MFQPKDTDWLNGYKIKPLYILYTRNPFQAQKHMQMESERMEKYIPCKWEAKESWSSNIHNRQNGT